MHLITALKIGIPIFFLLASFRETFVYLYRKRTFENWPRVEAVIEKSKLVDFHDLTEQRVYEARIEFSYSYAGKEYLGKTPALSGFRLFPAFGFQSELARKYNVGDRVQAHVYPTSPEIAYLEVAPMDKVSVFGGPLITIVAVAYFFYFGGIPWL